MNEREGDITTNDAEILFILAFSKAITGVEGLEVLRQIMQKPPDTDTVKEIIATEVLERLAENDFGD
ncbi:hypothetical protein A3F02_01745 [Candidatus Curtissbacteria bacterium RIFCSPHIGHO2_12_FULL_38_9b]|uniref:Uncharacterized protein n=1 Tax=Candidatus Curtissbacteria bacterium RIFCSPHIGHO2_12_FULL_38_9b TaxID=1797720 RepID=A0A1F5H099_9BACT|nr:MAG: hypothetical protein A3F02_01745 [Candidatus Curtissbacteria bacterium RIFCSPHIGHO2_12_FULL_38_9b]